MEELSLEIVKKAVPTSLKPVITQEFVDKINQSIADPYMAETIRDNFITYSHVLNNGKFKMEEYLNAIKYVSFKLMGMSNQDAYFKTFPDRYAFLTLQGKTQKDISAYVAAYHKTKLVAAILEQSFIPTWVLNQDAYQKAINTQVELMTSAVSEKVRAMAADSILNHLKKPEKAEALVNIDMRETQGVAELKGMLISLAQAQRKAIEDKNLTPKEIAEQEIVDVEVS